MKRLNLLLIWMVFIPAVFAQNADKYFADKYYYLAIEAYKNEVDKTPKSYLNLAKSYFAVKNYAEAKIAMQKYLDNYATADKEYAKWFIDMMNRADYAVPMKPVAGLVNTSGKESVPRISADGKILYFKAVDRAGGLGGEDIWYSVKQDDGTWGKPYLFTDLCTNSHETLYSMNADGNLAILFGNYQGSFGSGDLFYSVKTGTGWSMPCNLGGVINTSSWEAQATISPDGKVLVYVTENKLPGHVGGYDLYMSRLTDKGWTKPVNLGSKINTKESEIRPSFASDGKTLYFSSDGHPAFGGYDIFMSRRLDDTYTSWTTPVNLGRYINTLQDDEDVSVNTEGTIGYTVKSDEYGAPGGYDIFQFVMPDAARPEQTITLFGRVVNEKDSAAAVNLNFTSLSTKKLFKVVPSDKDSGKYTVYLPFDKYLMEINMKGYLYLSDTIDLSNPDNFVPKRNIREVFGEPTNTKVTALNAKLNEYTARLNSLQLIDNFDTKAVFNQYDSLLNDYTTAITEYKTLIAQSKYKWLSDEKKFVDVEKNLKVQRATAGATFKLDNIFFDLGKATIKDASIPSLDNLYEILKKNDISIELGGHSDSIGSEETNLRLSQDRVNSVRNYLVNKGISGDRIVAQGYGETKPVASNSTEEGRAQNRRVEVKIIEKPVGREGVQQTLVDVKDVKKENTPTITSAQQNLSGTEMLQYLKNAAKLGGLPDDSPCSDNYKPKSTVINTTPTTNKKSTKPWINTGKSTAWLNTNQFDRDDYSLKPFSLGISNFNSMDLIDSKWGIDMTFANRKKLESRGKVHENMLTFFPKNDSLNYGAGYQYLNFTSLKKLIALPIGFVWGVEGKYFNINDNSGNAYNTGLITIPVGLKALINIGSFNISPEAYTHIAIVSAKAEKDAGFNSSYFTLGASARWKFLYGGLNYSAGAQKYVQLKLGVTL